MMFLSFLLKSLMFLFKLLVFHGHVRASLRHFQDFQGAEEFESTSPRAVGRLGVPDIMIFCCRFDDV
jgi:hypothetical protein